DAGRVRERGREAEFHASNSHACRGRGTADDENRPSTPGPSSKRNRHANRRNPTTTDRNVVPRPSRRAAHGQRVALEWTEYLQPYGRGSIGDSARKYYRHGRWQEPV